MKHIDEEETSSRDNINNCHDPEYILNNSTGDTSRKKAEKELTTKTTFIESEHCNELPNENSKPMVYYIDEESFSKHQGIPSMKLVLRTCLERDANNVVILCNNQNEAILIESVLNDSDLECWKVESYIPYLKGVIPKLDDKKRVLKELDERSIIVSDYRSFRGCEASHSIIVVDPNNPVSDNIMVEMISRTIAYLDFVVLPTKAPSPGDNLAISSFTELVQYTNIEFSNKKKSEIEFKIQHPSGTSVVKVSVPKKGYNSLPYLEEKNQKEEYL